MSPRKTPLEQMRELAADGLEPWQIAAALGVREAAVAIALQTPTQGGAAGVVERIAGQSPLAAAADDAERDRQAAAAVVPPTFAAPDESDPVEVTPVVAAILAGAPAFLAVEAAASVALDRDPEYGTHVVPESWAEPGEPLPPVPDAAYPADAVVLDEPVIEEDDEPVEEQHDHEKPCDRCGVPAGTCCGHCSGAVAERLAVEQLEESEAEIEAHEALDERDQGPCGGCGLTPAEHDGLTVMHFWTPPPPAIAAHATVHQDGTVVEHDVVVRPNDAPHLGVETPGEHSPVEPPAAEVVKRLLDEARAEGEARFARAVEAAAVADRCAHDIGPAWTESGQAYALCATCGATWHRAPCDVCGVPVAALHIARTGTPRHAHHDLPRKD